MHLESLFPPLPQASVFFSLTDKHLYFLEFLVKWDAEYHRFFLYGQDSFLHGEQNSAVSF